MADVETVTIPKDEYEELQNDSRFLTALLISGVDNWEGFDFAIEAMDEDVT